jgi:predicted DNA binding CopG/RHH family protein
MKKNKSIYDPMDDEERQLIKDLENNEFVESPNQKEEVERLRSYFKYTANKDKRITLRVAQADLDSLHKKAKESGIPYQTLIGALIRQYAAGKIQLGV